MTVSEMVETAISEGIAAYKKNSKGTPEARRLDRHEPTFIDGQWYTCWREYAVCRMAEQIQEILPYADVEVELDGNASLLTVSASEEEQRELSSRLYLFLKKNCGMAL